MEVEEIAGAVATLPPDQLARFRRWFAAFEAGRTDHAAELDSTATKLGRCRARNGRLCEFCKMWPGTWPCARGHLLMASPHPSAK